MLKKRKRCSIRLKNYDYSQAGGYFVTICAQDKECIFGEIKNGEMILSKAGEIAYKCWLEIPKHFPDVILDVFIIMPNHIHGIIIIDKNNVGVQNFEPLQNKFQHIIPKSLGSIIRGYKIGVTKWCKQNGFHDFCWQRNYYEHVIRDEEDLNEIREYIFYNHLKWEDDAENPSFPQEIIFAS